MTRPVEGLPELSVLQRPAHLKSRYRRLRVIAHRRQLAGLDFTDADTLIVSTDWLAWRACVDAGAHAVHFESALEDWPAERGDPRALYLRAIEFVYDGDTDWTEFHGVSLGHLLLHSLGVFVNGYERVSCALDRLVRSFGAEEIVLVDVQSERMILSDQDKRDLVRRVASRNGIVWRDDTATRPADDGSGWPDVIHRVLDDPEARLKTVLRQLYSAAVGTAFRLRKLLSRDRPTVFVVNNPIVVHSLIGGCGASWSRLVVLGSQSPKTWRFLGKCWSHGVILDALPQVPLDRDDEAVLAIIAAKLEQRLASAPDDLTASLLRFVSDVLVNQGGLRSLALQVLSFDAFLTRARPDRVVVGDIGNSLNRIPAELAFRRGIPVDEHLNGMYLVDQHLEALVGGHGKPPLLTALLAWGPQNEEWIRRHRSGVASVRTGYAALDRIKPPPPPLPVGHGNVLILPPWIDGYDPLGLHSNKYTYTAEILKILHAHGYRNLRLKIHPGPPSQRYFEDVVAYSGVDCPVIKDGAINAHIEWADLVVGPVNSGSFVESMAAGKPYIPFRTYPSLLETDYTAPLHALDVPAELDTLLATGTIPDQGATLDYLCASATISEPVRAFWQAMDMMIAESRASNF